MRSFHRHLAFAVLLAAGPVRAQASDIDKAQAHFAAGRKLRTEGRCDLAIEEFTRAVDFEPNKVGPRLNLGDCFVELGRLPEAFRQFKEAERVAELAKDERRLANARTASAQVEAKMVRVVLREEEARVANITVQVDGVSIGTAPWHIVVAPGVAHDIHASALDGRSWNAKAEGQAGKVVRLTIAFSEPVVVMPAAEKPTNADASKVGPEKVAVSPDSSSPIPWRTVGWAGVGLGVVGIGVGAAFGIVATADKSDAGCDSAGYCNADPLASARQHATVSNIGFIAGGALVAGGLALVFFAPSGKAVTRVKAQATGIVVEGGW